MSRKNIHSGLSRKIEHYLCRCSVGELLPPEQQLADYFQVSKPTLRLALVPMIESGYLEAVNGVGNVVRKLPRTLRRELIFVCSDLVFFADTLKNFSMETTNSGYISSIVPLSGDDAMRERILNTVSERDPAGIVLCPGHPETPFRMSDPKLPVLHLIRRHGGWPGDVLSLQNSKSMAQLVRQFYSEGCRKFALFGRQVNPNAAREREQGFREGLGMVRLSVRENLICTDADSEDAFFENFRNPAKRPDAVCCMNDLCAGDLLCELKRRGIPYEGLRISGFDCSPVTAFFPRPIRTVRMPLAELGRRAAQLLIRRIENPALAPIHEKLESEQIETEPIGFINDQTGGQMEK